MKKKNQKKRKRKIKKSKKLDDFRNQNLRVIFEDIISHKREVREIEELTFKQLQNLKKKVNSIIRMKGPISSFSDEEEDKEEE